MKLMRGDCLDLLKTIPDRSVDMILTDPPYNIGCTQQKNKSRKSFSWDKRENYIQWCLEWLKECGRVLKSTGVLYMWHNDMKQIPKLLCEIENKTSLVFISFCIWDKGDAYRAKSWHQRDPKGKTALRSWFNVCEYCLHFFNAPKNADANWRRTGLERIDSNPECYKPIKDWYAAEKQRLGLDEKDIGKKYTEVTGKKPYMLRHYFQNSQFEIPTKRIFESVYEPLGFYFESDKGQGYEGLRQEYEGLRQEYEGLRQEYEGLRQEYENLRNVHICDDMHCNIWHVPPISTQHRYHTCQKPVEILERLCRVSTRENGVVLDLFMGSGSTGVACANTGRDFIGIELDPHYFEIAKNRIEEAEADKNK